MRQPTQRRAAPVSARPERPRRPAPHADLTALIDAAGGREAHSRAEVAAATAAALVRAGRTPGRAQESLVGLADEIGLDTLAELWRGAEPVSLPGALWALYALREWCRGSAAAIAGLWRAGEPQAAADAVVAGVAPLADAAALAQVADDVLTGAYRGDFAVALERAAALFRVLAAGRRELAPDGPRGAAERALAARNEQAARDLTVAAGQWRTGTLH